MSCVMSDQTCVPSAKGTRGTVLLTFSRARETDTGSVRTWEICATALSAP